MSTAVFGETMSSPDAEEGKRKTDASLLHKRSSAALISGIGIGWSRGEARGIWTVILVALRFGCLFRRKTRPKYPSLFSSISEINFRSAS